jgi:hypothetical protein
MSRTRWKFTARRASLVGVIAAWLVACAEASELDESARSDAARADTRTGGSATTGGSSGAGVSAGAGGATTGSSGSTAAGGTSVTSGGAGNPGTAGGAGRGGGGGTGGGGTGGSGTGGASSSDAAAAADREVGAPLACGGIPPWTSKSYALRDVVYHTCGGVFAMPCPAGQTHKFECSPMSGAVALAWCQQREPGVGNGWAEAWVDLGLCIPPEASTTERAEEGGSSTRMDGSRDGGNTGDSEGGSGDGGNTRDGEGGADVTDGSAGSD